METRRNRRPKVIFEASDLPTKINDSRKRERDGYKKEWAQMNRDLTIQWEANEERYNSLSIDEKIEFAKAGYKFDDQVDCPAIILCTSSIRMPRCSDRGVKVHKLFKHLPVGFIILFSKLEIVDVKYPTGHLLSNYQVGIPGGQFLVAHPEPSDEFPHGLGQFINSTIKEVPRNELGDVKWSKRQNMKKASCELVYANHCMSDVNKAEFPAYLKVVRPVRRGDELLYRYGKGFNTERVEPLADPIVT